MSCGSGTVLLEAMSGVVLRWVWRPEEDTKQTERLVSAAAAEGKRLLRGDWARPASPSEQIPTGDVRGRGRSGCASPQMPTWASLRVGRDVPRLPLLHTSERRLHAPAPLCCRCFPQEPCVPLFSLNWRQVCPCHLMSPQVGHWPWRPFPRSTTSGCTPPLGAGQVLQ